MVDVGARFDEGLDHCWVIKTAGESERRCAISITRHHIRVSSSSEKIAHDSNMSLLGGLMKSSVAIVILTCLTLAPATRCKATTTASWPTCAAPMRAVQPCTSTRSTTARAAIRAFTTEIYPLRLAICIYCSFSGFRMRKVHIDPLCNHRCHCRQISVKGRPRSGL